MQQNQALTLKRDLPYSLLGIPGKSNLNEVILRSFPKIRAILHNTHPRKAVSLDLEPLPNAFVYENELQSLLIKVVSKALDVIPFDSTIKIITYRIEAAAVLSISFPGIYQNHQDIDYQHRQHPFNNRMSNYKASMRIRMEEGITEIEFHFPIVHMY